MPFNSDPSSLSVDKRDLVLICFDDPVRGELMLWRFSIDADDLGLLEIEIAHYNDQIERVCRGLAGSECYERPEDRDTMYFQSEPSYKVKFSEKDRFPYDLSPSENIPELRMYSYTLNANEILNEFESLRTDDFLHPDALLRLITSPLCADQSTFSLGFRLLPLTDAMLTLPENFTPDNELLTRFGCAETK
jgi:hypothetical protein